MEHYLQITVVYDSKIVSVPINFQSTTAEDVCIYVCKQIGVLPTARHLFSLRMPGKLIYLKHSEKFAKEGSFELRIRFKVPSVTKLRKIDEKAYDYYFHQARNDVLENKIPDIIYEKYRRELVGLGITDMYRVMLEKDIPKETVENEYKKYIPKEVLKRHPFFIKKPIHDTLGKLQRSVLDAKYVKAEYLKQLDIIAPEYPSEVYKALTDEDGAVCTIYIKVTPSHLPEGGLKYSRESKGEPWNHICTIEDVGFVSIRDGDNTVEISRKNGIPFYLKFNQVAAMFSFISLLDGYYRLTCKWTFNICKEVPTPSLQKLYAMKCHGPVGGEFSYAKLEEKRGNRPGCFIVRESAVKYNNYYIDVCGANFSLNAKPKTFKLERISVDEFILQDDLTIYKSVKQIMAAYNDPDGAIFLQECLPPSEYDKSPLLLCQSESLSGDSLTDSATLNNLLPNTPLCINCKDLQVFKGQKKESLRGFTMIYRSMWKLTKGKKIEVAMKILKKEFSDNHLKEYLELAGQYAHLKSSAIVRFFGITLSSNVSLVMEYFRLGPMDIYLRENKQFIKPVDLIEAASNVASALWHLEENSIVHGNIRCRKLMVNTHDENSFTVKLCDPGIHVTYEKNEVHWIPVECYSNLDYAKRSSAADVWALATTLWEIFTFGEKIEINYIEAMRFYASGKRLPQPSTCGKDIYEILLKCWDPDPHRRAQPQVVMRDINQILYQVYNSRRTHSYAKVFAKSGSTIGESTSTLNSNLTQSTFMLYGEDLMAASEVEGSTSASSSGSQSQNWMLGSKEALISSDSVSCDFSNILNTFNFTTATSLDSINSLQSIFELDQDCSVVQQGRIGQGFYGDVYKGTLEYIGDSDMQPRTVAIKKLKTSAMSSCLQDFEREINIMKTLQHPNIVEILGVSREPDISLVMEYVQHGSLNSYLKINKESLHEKQLLQYALDIAQGMEYLGKKNIVHRDLAARNILVVDENHVKISDFGLAQVMGANDYYILKTSRELPIKWYAPESLRDGKFSVRSDVWSFAVTLCEMFNYGEEPSLVNVNTTVAGQEQQILLQALEAGNRFPCPQNCRQAIYMRIIYPCWNGDPHKRPGFANLVLETQDLISSV